MDAVPWISTSSRMSFIDGRKMSLLQRCPKAQDKFFSIILGWKGRLRLLWESRKRFLSHPLWKTRIWGGQQKGYGDSARDHPLVPLGQSTHTNGVKPLHPPKGFPYVNWESLDGVHWSRSWMCQGPHQQFNRKTECQCPDPQGCFFNKPRCSLSARKMEWKTGAKRVYFAYNTNRRRIFFHELSSSMAFGPKWSVLLSISLGGTQPSLSSANI